jgi:NAD(P)-dependent dehydrogenase (short-subunit alcohol dehydrogenase family)
MHNQADYPLALVTGAAHRVGRALALGLARRGYAVGLHYHASGEAAAQTAAEIEALGVPVLHLQADLLDETQIIGMFEQVAGSGLYLRVLVNSAAVMTRGDLRQMDCEDWDMTLGLNLRAPWLCAREAAPLMPPGSCMINIGDAGISRVWTGYPAYAVSKAGLEMLTRLLAKTLAPSIRVNAVAPGLILPAAGLPEGEWQKLVQRLPLQRPGSVDDLVKAVYLLLDNEYMTGQTVVVDGGYQLG